MCCVFNQLKHRGEGDPSWPPTIITPHRQSRQLSRLSNAPLSRVAKGLSTTAWKYGLGRYCPAQTGRSEGTSPLCPARNQRKRAALLLPLFKHFTSRFPPCLRCRSAQATLHVYSEVNLSDFNETYSLVTMDRD